MSWTAWQEALASPKEVAITSKFRLVQLKILHRIYYTRTTLYKIGKIDTPQYLRGCGETGTFIHTIWTCPLIITYWNTVTSLITRVCRHQVPREPKCCLLNVWDATDLNLIQQTWATLGMMIAKRNIASLWGGTGVPTIPQWCNDMDIIMVAEKTVYIHRRCPKKWIQKWGKWNSYRGNICEPPLLRRDLNPSNGFRTNEDPI